MALASDANALPMPMLALLGGILAEGGGGMPHLLGGPSRVTTTEKQEPRGQGQPSPSFTSLRRLAICANVPVCGSAGRRTESDKLPRHATCGLAKYNVMP